MVVRARWGVNTRRCRSAAQRNGAALRVGETAPPRDRRQGDPAARTSLLGARHSSGAFIVKGEGRAALECRAPSALRSILVVGFLAAVHQGAGEDAGIRADLLLDGLGDLGMFLEIGLGVLAALPDALAVIGEPRARLLDDAGLLP